MISSEKIKRRRLSAKERNDFYKMYGGRCAYCGAQITFRGMQIDHKIPLAINGEDTKENMLPACRSCNKYKQTLSMLKDSGNIFQEYRREYAETI